MTDAYPTKKTFEATRRRELHFQRIDQAIADADQMAAAEEAPVDEALSHFHKAFERLAAEPPTNPHLIFGKMTHEDWIKLNLRHAELHLSFVKLRVS